MFRILTRTFLGVLVAWAAGGAPAHAGGTAAAGDQPVAPPPLGVVVVGGGATYAPYHYLDHGRPTGFDVELLQAVAEVMGMELDIRLGPWEETRRGLEEGTIDVHAGMSVSPERTRRYQFTTPILHKQTRIFVRGDNREIRGKPDLAGRRIAVQREGVMAAYLQAHDYTDRLMLVESAKEALRAVASGRADCCVMSEFRGLQVLQEENLRGIVRVGEPVATSNYAFAVRAGRRDILLRLNLGLALVEQSGEYDRIYARWFGILDPGPSLWDYVRYAGWVFVPLLAVLALAFLWSWSLRRQVVRRTAELREARDQAEAASEAKTRFLTTMSHELRTPLNAVVGMAELLRTTDLDPRQREHLDVIGRAAGNLQDVIGDILEFADFDTGRRRLDSAEFDLAGLLDGVAAAAGRAARAKGLELRLDLDPGLPPRAVGDARALRKVLAHLLDNAVKFTAAGHVELSLRACDAGGGRMRLEGAVADTGCGVPAGIRTEIFAAFSQADTSSTRRHGGTGLGLAICRNLVDLMEGELTVADGPSGGAAFRFTAVLGAPTPAAVAVVASAGDTPDAGPILVVEDNPTNQRVVALLLRKWGYRFETADNGELAVAAFRSGRWGAVLMDCQMPVMDGLEATAAIRALEDGGGRRTPIIALTAGAFGSDRDRCLAAGMDDYLTKPINAAQLRKALRMWLAVGDGVRV